MLLPSPPYPLPQAPWKQAPMFPLLLCCIAGAVAGAWNVCSYVTWAVASLSSAVLSATIWLGMRRDKTPQGSIGVWLSGAMAVFFALAAMSSQALKEVDVNWEEKAQMWTGKVCQVVKMGRETISYDVELTAKEKGRKVRMFVKTKSNKPLQVGDRIAFWTTIRKGQNGGNPGDFDYQRYLLTHYISGSCYVKEKQLKRLKDGERRSFRSQMLRIRQQMVDQYRNFLGHTDLSILAALTLGDKSMLQPQVRQTFSDTGTSHILALSGLHMGLLIALLNLPLRFISRRGKRVRGVGTVVVISLLWLYVMLAGCSLSLIRSACMLSLAQIGAAISGGEHRALNNLSLAGIIILVVDPLAVFDVGFQLSFVAVFTIIEGNRYVWNRFPLPEWHEEIAYIRKGEKTKKTIYNFFKTTIYPFICVSLSAQWGTFPFVAYYFHTFSPYALIANFVVIPAAYVLLCCAMFFFLLPFPIVRNLMAWVMSSVVSGLVEVLQKISTWPFATLHVDATLFILLLVMGIPIVLYLFREHHGRRRRRHLLISFFALLTLAFVVERVWTYHHRVKPCIIVYKTQGATIGHFIQSANRSCLFSTVDKDSTFALLSYVRRNFWEAKDIAEPSFGEAPFVAHHDAFYVFRGKRILTLSGNVRFSTSQQASSSPTTIDLLIVTERCRTSYATVRLAFYPRHIILSQGLPRRLKEEWTAAATADGISCWDIAKDGAFVLPAEVSHGKASYE